MARGPTMRFDPAPPRAPMMPPREDLTPRASLRNTAHPVTMCRTSSLSGAHRPWRRSPRRSAAIRSSRNRSFTARLATSSRRLRMKATSSAPPTISIPGGQGWNGGEPQFDEDEIEAGRPPIAAHNDDFDEEFPDEDFDGDDYGAPQKGSRKKLFAALLLSAAAVVVGGGYAYKTFVAGKGGGTTPLIPAERSPRRKPRRIRAASNSPMVRSPSTTA